MKGLRAAAVVLALLAGSEGLLRTFRGAPPVLETAFRDEMKYLYVESRGPFFRRDGDAWTAVRPRALPQSVPVAKVPKELRIVLVGESFALRLGSDEPRRAFADDFLDKTPRVVNAGMGTYASAQWTGVLDDALKLSPDVVVLLAGNNEGLRADALWHPGWRLNLALRRLWLWRLAQDALMSRVAWRPDPAAVEARFESRLRAAARAAKSRGAAVVLATLPANLRGWPPDASHPEALAHWREARALDAAGKTREARAAYAAALDADGPGRCPPARNETIRRVAREEGAALADLAELFARRAPDGIPGWESFSDGVHPRPYLRALVAHALAAAAMAGPDSARDSGLVLREVGPFPPAPPLRPGPELDEIEVPALAAALQSGLSGAPALDARAVSALEFCARADAVGLRARAADPAALAALFARSPWTAPLVPLVPAGRASVRAHADEALRRAAGPAAAKLL